MAPSTAWCNAGQASYISRKDIMYVTLAYQLLCARAVHVQQLGGGVRVEVREQRKIKGTTKPLMAILHGHLSHER